MKFSEQWLRQWVNPAVDTATLCHQLTMAGLEVDAVEPVAPPFTHVVVGEVISAERHPDADKLQVCRVQVGQGEPLQIICGAANARAGLKVAAAVVGAELPGGLKIKQAKLRGVDSHGMLCSAKELGLADSSKGILELPVDAPVGKDLRDYLGLDDQTIELGLTPNRSDCLSVAGIAREVGVINRIDVNGPTHGVIAASIPDTFPIEVQAQGDCPRYIGRVIRGVRRDAPTPVWMQERLRRSGLRSIDVVVDITNYILLELGQPMHAFDLAKLQGGIVVRHAAAGEGLLLLNDQEVSLTAGTLVIADHKGPLALAGVMGGAASAVGAGTQDLLLEAAFFNPVTLAGRARGYGLHTDSSHRFERGVDFALQGRAMERATELLLELAGGQAGPLNEVVANEQLPVRAPVALRHARLQRVLGGEFEASAVTDMLTRLGMAVTKTPDGWEVTPPSYRFDIAIEVDLIEEVARIHGYDHLPSHPPQGSMAMRPRPESHTPLSRLRQLLVDRDYQEVITYSFVDPALQGILFPGQEAVALANPISAEMSVMRTSLLPGLVATLRHNLNRQQSRVRVFESGLKFVRVGNDMVQTPVLAGAICGSRTAEQWGSDRSGVDFYDIKGDVEALLASSPLPISFRPLQLSALHPGQSAEVWVGEEMLGWLGAVHPALEQSLDLDQTVYAFELDLSRLQQSRLPRFSSLSKFPSIRRDLAIVVDQAVTAAQVRECIRQDASELLQDVILFDVYVGKGIDSGRKSLALGLTLQDNSRTLTDDDVDGFIAKIVSGLGSRLGATLRV